MGLARWPHFSPDLSPTQTPLDRGLAVSSTLAPGDVFRNHIGAAESWYFPHVSLFKLSKF